MSGRRVRARKWLARVALIWSVRIIRFFARLLPYRWGVSFGGKLGRGAYYILSRERNRAITHLTFVFRDKGDDWIRGTAHRMFEHLGKAMFEILLITPARLAEVVEFRGIEKITDALAGGKGAISFTGHIGNWELLAYAIGSRYPLSGIAVPIEPEQINDIIVGLRARMGIRTILRNRPGASRELIRIFRQNRLLGLLIDQDTDVEGAFVDFMGRPAWTPTAVASIAIRFNTPVFFGYIKRKADGNHVLTMEGPLELIRTGNDERDIVTNTALFTKKIEERILENPEQWVWMHRRWRRQP